MTELVRFSVSIEKPLYDRMGELARARGYQNRSEFIRDLIRERSVGEEWKRNEKALGTITLIYDHHKRHLSGRLVAMQHEFHREVLASTHVHLDDHLCAEMILVTGRAKQIEDLANALRKQKGVLHVGLAMGSTGKELS